MARRTAPESKLGAATLDALSSFATLMVDESTDIPDPEVHGGFRSGRLESEPGMSLMITGGDLRSFAGVLDRLCAEPELEHLSRKTLDAALWELAGDLFINREAYRSEPPRGPRVSDFVTALARPWQEYEVLSTIDHLDVPGDSLIVNDVTYQGMTEGLLEYWLGRNSSHIYADDLRLNLGKTVAQVRVSAGDHDNATSRAKSAIDASISSLRYAVANSSRVAIPDVQLLFKRGQHMWLSLVEDPNQWGTSGELGFRPVQLSLAGIIRTGAEVIISDQMAVADSQLKRVLKLRVRRAVHWIGISATRENYDDKIVDLCTAAECFLASKSDPRKGENIALRGMLLSEAMGEVFSEPLIVFDLYNRRSAIVHGTGIDVCGEGEYLWMRGAVSRLLNLFISFILREKPAGFGHFIDSIESSESVAKACDWLDVHPDPDGKTIADYIRKSRLGSNQLP